MKFINNYIQEKLVINNQLISKDSVFRLIYNGLDIDAYIFNDNKKDKIQIAIKKWIRNNNISDIKDIQKVAYVEKSSSISMIKNWGFFTNIHINSGNISKLHIQSDNILFYSDDDDEYGDKDTYWFVNNDYIGFKIVIWDDNGHKVDDCYIVFKKIN